MKELDLDADLRIDPLELDVEWIRQPVIYKKWGKQYAKAQKKAERAEQAVKVCKAELVNKICKRPKKHTGKEKPTGQQIEAAYRDHPKHKRLKEELAEAHFEANMLREAMTALRQRRDALTQLTSLHGQEYFSTPKHTKALDKRLVDKMEKAKEGARNELFMRDKKKKRKKGK